MNIQPVFSLASLPPVPLTARVILVVTRGKEPEGLTELITRLALRGPFHLIAGGEWVPDQDSLRRSVRGHTLAVRETLDHLILARPFTCLQLREQLTQADAQDHLIVILDFLHHFYNPDVELSLRQRVLEECCLQIQHLSRSKPVIVIVQHLPVEEYQHFYSTLVSFADEIFEAEQVFAMNASQESLF